MKRLIFASLLLLLLPLRGAAQNDVETIRKALDGNRISLIYRFGSESKLSVSGSGRFIAEGNCYRSAGNGIEIICDGKTRWTVDTKAKEVYIESAGGIDDFLSNPALFLDSVKDFKIEGKTASGVYVNPSDGNAVSFKLMDMKSVPASGTSDFSFDIKVLDSSWVVTDLR